MKRICKSMLFVVATVALCFALTSVVSALDETGQCGENVYWNYDSTTKELIISGSGPMYDYDYFSLPFSKSDVETIVINKGVTSIGSNAFNDCKKLTSITIPDSVTRIATNPFNGCTNLSDITVDENNPSYSSDEFGVLFNKNKTTLIQYPIGNTRTNYTIPDSVTKTSEYAFKYCHNLTDLTIGNGITAIEYKMFHDCNNLTSITVNKNNPNYSNDESGVLFNKNKTILIYHSKKQKHTSYTIPDTVRSINDSAFKNCTNLTNVIIPNSVTSIGDSAFKGCTNLKSLIIPDSITYIGTHISPDCRKLEIYYNGTYSKWNSIIKSSNASWSFWRENPDYSEYSEPNFYDFHPCKVITNEATCAKKGSVKYTCIECDTSYTTKETPATGKHTYKAAKTSPTCTKGGYTTNTCTCGDSYVTNKVDALGHIFTKYISDNNATYTADGTKTAKCDRCSATKTITDKGSKLFFAGKPSKIIATSNTSAIKITWSSVTNASTYAIYQKISGNWKKLGICSFTSTTINGLKSGTKYEFAVKAATKLNGIEVWSNTYTTIQTATKAVKPAKIVAAQNTSAIKLTWTTSPGATGYRIYYKSGNTWKVTVSTTSKTSHTFTGLKAGAKYTFAVRPYVLTDSGVVWSDYTTYTATTTPATVTAKTSSTSTGKINLSWNQVNGADGYRVYYQVGNGSYKLYKTVKGVNSLTFSGLKSGTKYTFAVRAGISTTGGIVWSGYNTSTVTVK